MTEPSKTCLLLCIIEYVWYCLPSPTDAFQPVKQHEAVYFWHNLLVAQELILWCQIKNCGASWHQSTTFSGATEGSKLWGVSWQCTENKWKITLSVRHVQECMHSTLAVKWTRSYWICLNRMISYTKSFWTLRLHCSVYSCIEINRIVTHLIELDTRPNCFVN